MKDQSFGLIATLVLFAFLIALLAFFTTGCVRATITVIDERTALENQILGSYEELDRDLQLAASVRSADEPTILDQVTGLLPLRESAMKARRNQQFYRDDIDEMKKAGCLGETNDGNLATRPCPAAHEGGGSERLKHLVETENRAREILLKFIVATSPDLTSKDLPQVVLTFARIQRETALPGTWIQDDAGEWKTAP